MYECMSNSNSLSVYAGFALIHYLIHTAKTHTLECMRKKQGMYEFYTVFYRMYE